MDKRIVLAGFMGAGKTYSGRIIANRFNLLYMDTDEQIEKNTGLSINEIFMHGGESYFRRLERSVISGIHKEKVISVGAGIVELPINREWLAQDSNYVVWLNPAWEVIYERISTSNRPKVRSLNKKDIYELWERRTPLYEETADLIYEKDDVEGLIQIISEKLALSQPAASLQTEQDTGDQR